MNDTATIRTVEHGQASELPTISWRWRRVFVFLLTAALCGLVWRVSERVSDVPMLHDIARIALGIIALLVFVYVAGATATDCVQLVSALRTTRKETMTTAAAPATLTSSTGPDGATTTTTAGGELPPEQRVNP